MPRRAAVKPRRTPEPSAPNGQGGAGAVTATGTWDRWVGALAVAAGPLTLLGLVLGLVLVDFDAEAFRDPAVVLGLGTDAARMLRTSYLLVMLGSYLLLVPLAVWLWSRFGARRLEPAAVTTLVAGLAYLGLGAAGAAILAAVWPALIAEAAAPGADGGAIRTAFVTATRIAEDGLQGALQNIAGGFWWLAVGLQLRAMRHRKLAILTLVLGVASSVNALGSLLSAEALTLPGLTLTVLLAPVWSVCAGVSILRGRFTGTSE